MKFIFLRHAQATHNSDAKARGDVAYFDPVNADAALDDVGLEQILTHRQNIGAIDAVYCSPLQRCRQTLIGFMPASNEMQIHLDDRLMEPQGSAVCNKRAERLSVIQSSPPSWDASGVSECNPFDSARDGYSSDIGLANSFYTRVRGFTESMAAAYEDDHVILIVTHHDWIRTWFSIYTRLDVSARNCEILRVSFDRKKLIGSIGI